MVVMTDSPPYEAFRSNVRRLMELHGISQVELAERAGLEQPHVSRMLTGKVEPRLSTVYRIAEALDTQVPFLLTRISEKAAIPA